MAWLNSTLGLMGTVGIRVDTRGAWTQFKKPMLEEMPVLDPRGLSPEQLAGFSAAFDAVAGTSLLPFPEIGADPGRAELDRRIAGILGLPELGTLRTLLAQEPTVCLHRLH